MVSTATEPTRFTVYPLAGLLPEGLTLVLNQEQGVLTLLQAGEVIEQQILSPSEMYVVEALLSDYPDYCPYETILASVNGKSVERCRALINQAEENGSIDPVMRPVRNLLGRVRLKLLPFGITVRSMVHMGYMLIPAQGGYKREE